MRLKDISVKADRAEQGAWVNNIPWQGVGASLGLTVDEATAKDLAGVSLRVRGLNTVDARRLRKRLLNAVKPDEKIGSDLDPAVEDGIEAQMLADVVLVDWAGIEGDDGEPLPYSKEMAKRLMTEPQFVLLRGAARFAAATVMDRGKEKLEADLGNSVPSSPGPSNGAPTKRGSRTKRARTA